MEMRYFVNLDPAPGSPPIVVDLTELPSGELDVLVDGKRVPVDLVALNGTLSIRVGNRMVDLTTEGSGPELGAVASGHRSYVRVESDRQRAAAAARKGGATGTDNSVRSPMPGRVVRLLVAAKQEVIKGQTLCVIEAMKMENEIKAKGAATIAEVHVTEGATVDANATLLTFA
jgi:biotin carboxyl carrier protein